MIVHSGKWTRYPIQKVCVMGTSCTMWLLTAMSEVSTKVAKDVMSTEDWLPTIAAGAVCTPLCGFRLIRRAVVAVWLIGG